MITKSSFETQPGQLENLWSPWRTHPCRSKHDNKKTDMNHSSGHALGYRPFTFLTMHMRTQPLLFASPKTCTLKSSTTRAESSLSQAPGFRPKIVHLNPKNLNPEACNCNAATRREMLYMMPRRMKLKGKAEHLMADLSKLDLQVCLMRPSYSSLSASMRTRELRFWKCLCLLSDSMALEGGLT